MKKNPCIHHGSAFRRILTTTVIAVLGIGAIIAAPSTAQARRPRIINARPACTIPNCVEIYWPANGKSGPMIIRCKQGEPCNPLCTRC